ncbi:2-oxo-4-hydroxy-4-carboxy-5-ureidoimidazoline decarboxylase [Streptomyces sp. MST-110588]|uniref:2-oxo-4-hydroxy-4-carboxy-5-ureidoimidazoline decarboxylase n=1 Tax=Streptomyces sp. MST-110588 TaxID=2833628 RepID=UPI003242D834
MAPASAPPPGRSATTVTPTAAPPATPALSRPTRPLPRGDHAVQREPGRPADDAARSPARHPHARPARGRDPLLPSCRPGASGLERLNAATRRAAEDTLLTCCGSRRWARRLAEHRPYPDTGALLAACDEASYDLTRADLDEALAAETDAPYPPVSTHGPGPGPESGSGPRPGALAAHPAHTFQRAADTHTAQRAAHAETALRAAHAEYERKFRYAFVICLDGVRESERLNEVLSAIRVRMGNEEEKERAIAAEELRRIARSRLLARIAGRQH